MHLGVVEFHGGVPDGVALVPQAEFGVPGVGLQDADDSDRYFYLVVVSITSCDEAPEGNQLGSFVS